MKTIEDRLRDALAERAKYSPIDPDAWVRIRARSLAGPRRHSVLRWRLSGRFLIPAAAAAAVVAIVVGVTAAVSGITGRSAGAPAGGTGSAGPTPATSPRPAASPTDWVAALRTVLIDYYPPASALLAFPMTAPEPGRTAVAYAWLAYASPYAWLDQLQGLQSCTWVKYPQGGIGFCSPLPQLGPRDPARVTNSNYMSGTMGPLVLQGLAVNQVVSVTAVLPDGQSIAGLVKTGRGFTDKAWAVVAPADEATRKPVSGIRLVFRDASGAEVATLSTAAPKGPPLVAEPRTGGIVVLKTPENGGKDDSVTAYLMDGYVGFFSPGPLGAAQGSMAPQLAAGPPALSGLSLVLGGVSKKPDMTLEAVGYAHANVVRVVLRMGDGRPVSTSTFSAWPGSGLRLWTVPVWQGRELRENNGLPTVTVTATGYNAAGQAVAHVTLGSARD